MPGTEFKIKSDNPWDSLLVPEGKELAVGGRIYNGARTMLVNGVETEIAEPVWGGEYSLENGKIVSVVDGVITEIKDAPGTATGQLKKAATDRRTTYRKK
jgi:hypothetical protein